MNRPNRRVLQIGALVVIMAASVGLASYWAGQRSLRTLSEQKGEQLHLRALSLQRLVDRYNVLPTVLALDPELRHALIVPPTPSEIVALNQKLERANGATHVSTLTLINRHGVAIAASNWQLPSSNVGLNYTFRPYFQRAMQNGVGTFYAIGVSTHLAGYFIAHAIYDDTHRRIGVIVVKISLEQILSEWSRADDTILLSDDHGIVFLSNQPGWDYRPLQPLQASTIARIASTRQYTDHLRAPARLQADERLPYDGRLVDITSPGQRRVMIAHSLSLPAQGWTIHSLSDTGPVTSAQQHAALIALGAWLPVILVGVLLDQRLHLATERQRYREELERLVAHYASALRSEQDSLVQAALHAARGHREQLEHLPQGVSVVDADLHLVAWNRRYEEIFDFPAHLLEVGRPIEDLIRYNARRGMLGMGSIEETITRRLDYLCRGGPHIHEREDPDGRVLEIRGHPLPGGGFVTSYADITPYKKAARALRSLTTTLERRIEKSTRELRIAKAEAERANRNKTRYVAAAVHDLLQPLNAARLFSGALHKTLCTPTDREMLDRIEQALQALDSQLGSMLDLSGLEAGALQPKIDDVELSPLLQSLTRQFGIVAQARNLSLRLLDTRAWVRSDPMLLRRILQNFLSNALHYTPRGKVLLGCRRHGSNLRIEVWDTGVGIPPDKREAIFREFARLDSGVDTNERNAGLGLSIVERIAGLLGHPVTLRSWPGRGSVFSIEVPRVFARNSSDSDNTRTLGESSADYDDSPLAGRRIACVDPSRENADALAALLHSWECEVTVADDWKRMHASGFNGIDLILVDRHLIFDACHQLPFETGLKWNGQPPIIVMTSQLDPDARRRMRKSGMHVLVKPVSPARLRALMSQLLVATSAV